MRLLGHGTFQLGIHDDGCEGLEGGLLGAHPRPGCLLLLSVGGVGAAFDLGVAGVVGPTVHVPAQVTFVTRVFMETGTGAYCTWRRMERMHSCITWTSPPQVLAAHQRWLRMEGAQAARAAFFLAFAAWASATFVPLTFKNQE